MFRLLLCVSLLFVTTRSFPQRDAERKNMVDKQIKARGVSDAGTLRAMMEVPRHLFVPDNVIDQAYDDRPLYIGHGQTISQPFIVAVMTEVVEPKRDMKVLEIGTGSGYQAAVLSKIVDQVFTIEIVEPLGESARKRLDELNYDNIKTKIADGYYGWEEYGPFDAIVVTAAAEHIPPPLIKQLKVGGKMIIPVGAPFFTQKLIYVEKVKTGVRTKNLMFVRFVPFTRKKKD